MLGFGQSGLLCWCREALSKSTNISARLLGMMLTALLLDVPIMVLDIAFLGLGGRRFVWRPGKLQAKQTYTLHYSARVACIQQSIISIIALFYRPISVKIKCANGSEVVFRITAATPFFRVHSALAAKLGVDIDTLRLLSDGDRVAGDDTPDSLRLEDGDTLDAVIVDPKPPQATVP